ncbi:unnamed protein product, partial [marine sediment metagenome]
EVSGDTNINNTSITNTITNIVNEGGSLTAAEIWDEPMVDHLTEGTTGEKQSRSDRIGR